MVLVDQVKSRMLQQQRATINFFLTLISGDITEVQPKAIGSSIINKLTNCLALDALKISGKIESN